MRLTYGKTVRLDGVSESQQKSLLSDISKRIRQMIEERFQKNPQFIIQSEGSDEEGLSITVTRGSFLGQVDSFLGRDLLVVDGKSQSTSLLKVSANCKNIALETAYEYSDELKQKYMRLGVITLGTAFAIITILFSAAFLRKIYFLSVFLAFAIGGGIGSMVGVTIGEKYIQQEQSKQHIDRNLDHSKKEWAAFINDLMAAAEPLEPPPA